MRYIPVLAAGQMTFIALAVAEGTTGTARTIAFIVAFVLGVATVRLARSVLGERSTFALGAVAAVLGLLALLDQGLLPVIHVRF